MSEPTKLCPDCLEVKPWSQFRARTRWEDGSTRTVQSYCRECDYRRSRRYAQRARARLTPQEREEQARRDAEYRREYQCWRTGWDPAYREARRAYNRASYERMRNDPKAWKRYVDGQRERYQRRAQQRRAETNRRLPAGPLRRVLLPLRTEWETTTLMAEAIGMDDSQLGQLLSGRKQQVTLDTADRVLCRIGHPELLNELYPLDEGELAA